MVAQRQAVVYSCAVAGLHIGQRRGTQMHTHTHKQAEQVSVNRCATKRTRSQTISDRAEIDLLWWDGEIAEPPITADEAAGLALYQKAKAFVLAGGRE